MHVPVGRKNSLASPGPGPSLGLASPVWGFGLGLAILKPKPPQAGPKPGLPGRAGPWTSLRFTGGLLHIFVACGTRDFGRNIEQLITLHLREVIPGSLVYYFTVKRLKHAIADSGLQDLVSTLTSTNPKLAEVWDQFSRLAQKRVELLDAFCSTSVLLRTCDNTVCGQIRDKFSFRRCAGCQVFHYCSQACQIQDWKHGGHRGVCGSHRYLGLTARMSFKVGARERAFLRALLDRDYQEHRAYICALQVQFMVKHLCCVFFTSFDYQAGHVEIAVQAVDDLGVVRDVLDSAGAESQREIFFRFWVVPLRTNSPNITRGLRALAAEISEKNEALNVAEEVAALIRREIDVVEIH
ncbi:hypothetical protein C8R43DRAFT_1239305 [Mycena crocata]|nr:hypothetical protein C8R43DRAFT_1239305 [Mycena crocata]